MQLKRDDNSGFDSPEQGGAATPRNEYYDTQSAYNDAGPRDGQSPYGQPGQSPYGQPGQSPYGQPGQSPYGQPGQSSYGQPGQSPYGQAGGAPYGQTGSAPYGQSAYGRPGQTPYGAPNDPYSQQTRFNQSPSGSAYSASYASTKSGVPAWVIGLLVLAVLGVGAYLFFGTDVFGKRFKPGKVSGNKFKNEYFGVEIDGGVDGTMMGYAGSEDAEKKDLEKNYQAVNELILTTNKGEILMFSVLNTGQDIKGNGYTDSEIMDQMEGAFKSTIAGSGYADATVEKTSLSIGGRTRQGFSIKAPTAAGTAYCNQYYIFSGKYVGFITSVAYSNSRSTALITEHVKKCDPD